MGQQRQPALTETLRPSEYINNPRTREKQKFELGIIVSAEFNLKLMTSSSKTLLTT